MPGCSECARLATQASNILGGLADFSFGPDADVVFVEYKADGTTQEHTVASIAKMMRLQEDIVQYGDNANGSYIIFENKVAIASYVAPDYVLTDNLVNDNWYSDTQDLTFPIGFISEPVVSSATLGNGYAGFASFHSLSSTGVSAEGKSDRGDRGVRIGYIAIGMVA